MMDRKLLSISEIFNAKYWWLVFWLWYNIRLKTFSWEMNFVSVIFSNLVKFLILHQILYMEGSFKIFSSKN